MSKSDLFIALSDLLEPFSNEMIVKHDTDTNYYLEEEKSSKKPQMFGAVQVKKNYTSFHLFPVYVHPELVEDISDDLRKRMQGKSCFNFKSLDQVPREELSDLVKRAHGSL